MAGRFRLLPVALIITGVVGLVAPPAAGAPGDLDGSFSGDGYALTTFPGGGGAFYGVALDGSAPTGCGQGGIVLIGARRESGAFDSTFSGDGKLRIDPLDTGESAIESCMYLPDGRLLGVGWVGPDESHRMLVVMLTPSGRPDPRFSGDGFAAIRFPGFAEAYGYALSVQENGRIVVVGEATDGSDGDFAVARLTPAGAFDDSFSRDGRTTVHLGPGSDGAWKVAIDSAGRIVLAGWSRDVGGADYDAAAAVLQRVGRRDRDFGDHGSRVYDFVSGDDYVNGLDLRPDGRIVLGVSYPGVPGHAVAQLGRRGGFDDSFGGGDGIVENVTPAMTLRDLELDGPKIVFGGEWNNAPQFVRLRKLGGLDGTFGTGGVAPIPELAGASVADLVHDRYGRIVASGTLSGPSTTPLLLRIDG